MEAVNRAAEGVAAKMDAKYGAHRRSGLYARKAARTGAESRLLRSAADFALCSLIELELGVLGSMSHVEHVALV